jgi:hypothetical protein
LEVFAMGDGGCGGCFPQEILIGPFIVPEPTTITLLAVAMIGFLTRCRLERGP